MKLQEREFFSLPAPEIATANNAAKRRRLVEKLEAADPALLRALPPGTGRGRFGLDVLPHAAANIR